MPAKNQRGLSVNLSMNRQVSNIVEMALSEDIGTGDVSASLLKDTTVSAQIIAREAGVICGIEYAQTALLALDGDMQIEWQLGEGDKIQKNQLLCTLSGSSRAIISAERVALNFLQTLSAVATQTRHLVDKIAHTHAQLLDTRKTIPGLRLAQKYAVKCGGGVNHRMGLYDCMMLKENHIMAAGGITQAVAMAKAQYADLALIVEVEDLTQLSEVLTLKGITRVLCDNFSLDRLVQAVDMSAGIVPLEASGNIDSTTIVSIAQTGVDFISIGSITKNIQAIDLSLRFI